MMMSKMRLASSPARCGRRKGLYSLERTTTTRKSQRIHTQNTQKSIETAGNSISRRTTHTSPSVRLLASASATSLALLGVTYSTNHLTSLTWCDAVNTSSTLQQAPKQSAFDLVIPSLQALLRVIRLLQTTGLIVLDYEMYKWTKKANKFIENFSPSSSSDESNTDVLDLSKMSESQKRNYWEKEVKRRHDIFEEAQIAYATPTTQEERDNIPEGMTLEDWKLHQKQLMKEAAATWVEAEDELQKVGGSNISQIHTHAAQRLVSLCRTNAGCYIKVGQHIANLDYLIPQEYIDCLQCLLDDAPTSSYDQVSRVIQEELGASPEELFDKFDPTPIASASLAQVHVAYEKNTGRKLAVKVQHEGLRETCKGDLLALTTVVHTLEYFLEDFNFGWIADEIAPQLPLELDFQNEAKNAEKAASFLEKRKHFADVVIPKVIWDQTSNRVLCMEFEEGFRASDVESIRKANLKPKDVAQLISRVFHSQTFLDAWVHCDPHPANCLLRKSPVTGKPQMVLVDHGLYKQLDDDFRITYAKLWKALMMADIPQIKSTCSDLGVEGKLFALLSGLLTARPFDEVVERSKSGGAFEVSSSSSKGPKTQQDKAVIRGYAQKFLVDILTMIDMLPRQMVLLLKMNDCLRHIDYALGSPQNNLVAAGKIANQAVYEHSVQSTKNKSMSTWERLQAWVEYLRVLWRIQVYELLIESRKAKTIKNF